ncbi:MAG: tetratricopeptide repeat protein, partial [Chloroflexi bacterium]|nr:tetratricopeptide repeat protein [Chloroflexota bacterium]
AQTLGNLGLVYQDQGRWAEAISAYEQSLSIKRELGDRHGEAQTLGNHGSVYQSQGHPAEALAALETALTTFRQLGDRLSEAQTLNNLGLLYYTQGEFEDALKVLGKSREGFDSLGLSQQAKRADIVYADTACEMGKRYAEQGRWYDGLRLLEESLAIRRQNGDLNVHADTIYQIARTHQLMNNLDTARVHYRDALRLYEHTGNRRGVAACKAGLGHVAVQMGFASDAVQELTEAQRIYAELGDTQHADDVEQILQLTDRVRERQPA